MQRDRVDPFRAPQALAPAFSADVALWRDESAEAQQRLRGPLGPCAGGVDGLQIRFAWDGDNLWLTAPTNWCRAFCATPSCCLGLDAESSCA